MHDRLWALSVRWALLGTRLYINEYTVACFNQRSLTAAFQKCINKQTNKKTMCRAFLTWKNLPNAADMSINVQLNLSGHQQLIYLHTVKPLCTYVAAFPIDHWSFRCLAHQPNKLLLTLSRAVNWSLFIQGPRNRSDVCNFTLHLYSDYFVLWVPPGLIAFGHGVRALCGGAFGEKGHIWSRFSSRAARVRGMPRGLFAHRTSYVIFWIPWTERQPYGLWLIGGAGHSISPCVQSNPHQGHLLQFLSMELLGKHKLWINFRLSEGGKRRLMGRRHIGLGQRTKRGLLVSVLNYCPLNHQNHLGFLLYHNTLFHLHHWHWLAS